MVSYKSAKWSTAHACQALKLCLVLADSLGTIALLRIIEANVCRNYYREHDPGVINAQDHVAESVCKVTGVQVVVAQVNGLLSGLTSFPALLSALPFLALHRVMNQKKLLLLNVLGILLENLYFAIVLYFYNTFDPRAIALYGFFGFVGGGYPVFDSVLQAKIAESVPLESLSTFQLYYTAASLLVKMFGTSLGLSLMRNSPWLPIILMLCVHCVMIPLAFIFFENPVRREPFSKFTGHLVPSTEEDVGGMSRSISDFGIQDSRTPISTSNLIWNAVRDCQSVFWSSLVPVTVILFYDSANSFHRTMPYWMSRRYHWELREVGWVQLGEKLWIALTVALLPRFAKRFFEDGTRSDTEQLSPMIASVDQQEQENHLSLNGRIGSFFNRSSTAIFGSQPTKVSDRRDLRLTKFCVLVSALGTFFLGFSWNRLAALMSLLVLSGGYGFRDAYYSFLASRYTPRNNSNARGAGNAHNGTAATELATLYMVLSLMSTFAYNLGGWLVSLIDAFALTVSSNDNKRNTSATTGLPVWFSTMSFLLSWWCIRRSKIVAR